MKLNLSIKFKKESAKLIKRNPSLRNRLSDTLKYLPKDYIVAPASAESMMGSHWIDPDSPEFNGEKFSKTFIYGFYDGEMIFWEPMVTKAFLETKPNLTENIKQPEKYERTGLYYPTSYSINYDSTKNVYTVSFGDFVLI